MVQSYLKSFHQVVFVSTNRRVLAMTAIFMTYLLFGAYIFGTIEKIWMFENPLDKHLTSSTMIRDMVTLLRGKNFSDSQIKASFSRQHYYKVHDASEFQISWIYAYGETTMFALVLIATLGYGNVVPTNEWGRAFTIVYLIIGRSVHLIMIRLIAIKYRSIVRKTLKSTRPLSRYFPEGYRITRFITFLTGFCVFFFFSVVFIFGPAAIFGRFENWSYLEAVYFSLLSLSTIGLGDYIAGLSSRNYNSWLYTIYVILQYLWLVFGISFMFVCYNSLSYIFGLFILDKLDCKCVDREKARAEVDNIYNMVADLNWKLTKLCPKEFKEQRVFQEFLDKCVDTPEEITEEVFIELFDTIEELKIAASSSLKKLELPEEDIKFDKDILGSTENVNKQLSEETLSRNLKDIIFKKSAHKVFLQDPGVAPIDKLRVSNDLSDIPIDIESSFKFVSSKDLAKALMKEKKAETKSDKQDTENEKLEEDKKKKRDPSGEDSE